IRACERQSGIFEKRLNDWERYAWLVSIADTQAENIEEYVKTSQITFGDTMLDEGVPYIKFVIYVTNSSILDVILEIDARASYITFKDTKLAYPLILLGDERISIRYQTRGCISLEQRLSREEAAYIALHKDNENSTFYLDKIMVTIKGGSRHPPVKTKRLYIDKGITLQNKELTF
ncbi:MAG TPA: hypothetical protein VHU19_08440, partial [Pyrinomonadaceae bacterium]|nr:hypothetical protein [Pyrinomonadaceae bacterium]